MKYLAIIDGQFERFILLQTLFGHTIRIDDGMAGPKQWVSVDLSLNKDEHPLKATMYFNDSNIGVPCSIGEIRPINNEEESYLGEMLEL